MGALVAVAVRERRERRLPLGHPVGIRETGEGEAGHIALPARREIGERDAAQTAAPLGSGGEVCRGWSGLRQNCPTLAPQRRAGPTRAFPPLTADRAGVESITLYWEWVVWGTVVADSEHHC